jgi:hypothetical protein
VAGPASRAPPRRAVCPECASGSVSNSRQSSFSERRCWSPIGAKTARYTFKMLVSHFGMPQHERFQSCRSARHPAAHWADRRLSALPAPNSRATSPVPGPHGSFWLVLPLLIETELFGTAKVPCGTDAPLRGPHRATTGVDSQSARLSRLSARDAPVGIKIWGRGYVKSTRPCCEMARADEFQTARPQRSDSVPKCSLAWVDADVLPPGTVACRVGTMISAFHAPCWHGLRGIRICSTGSAAHYQREGRTGRASVTVGERLYERRSPEAVIDGP